MNEKKITTINLIALVLAVVLIIVTVFSVINVQKNNSTGEALSYQQFSDKYTYKNTKKTSEGGIANIGDPHVFWDEASGKWYMTGTSGGTHVKIWSSEDLTTWDEGKIIIENKDISWAFYDPASGAYGLWGAEIHKVGDQYQLYFSTWGKDESGNASTSPRIGVAVCDTVDGIYQATDKPLFDFGYSAIDNHLFTDEDGKRYMVYCRDATDNVVNNRRESHIYIVELNADGLSVKEGSEPTCLITPEYSWETATPDPKWVWTEGCWMQKMNGKYYLFYSASKFSTWDYCIGYAVSDSPMGPFVKNPEPLMQTFANELSGPGNNSFFTSKDGKELFTAYHMHTTPANPSGNRYLNIDRIGLREDGTVYVNAPTFTDQPLPSGEKDGHTLLSDEAKIVADTAEGYKASAINDGEVAVVDKYKDNEWCAAKPVDEAVLRLEWDKAVEINSIFIYNSIIAEHATVTVDIKLSNGVVLESIKLGEFGGEAGIVNLNGVKSSWIEISVADKSAEQTAFALSEVMVFGTK